MYGYPQDNVNRHLPHPPLPLPPPLQVPDRLPHQLLQQPPSYIMPLNHDHHISTAHQPPPLHLVGSVQQQKQTQQQQHLSSEITDQSVPERPPRPAPEDFSALHDGRIYKLHVRQQPIRARMCGFGDKDRRPITPPPCIRLIVQDQNTGAEVPVNEIDISFYTLMVDIWDEDGLKASNTVKTANTGSPSISTATTIAYPPASVNAPPPYPPSSGAYFSQPSAQPTSATSYHSMSSYQGALGSTPSSAYSQQYPPQQFPPHHYASQQYPSQHYPSQQYLPQQYPPRQNSYPVPPGPNAYQQRVPSPSTPTASMASYPGHMANPQHHATQPINQAPNSQIQRNLIGNTAASASRLYDENEKVGVWFVLQDLSVRTEGRFRLKFDFMNLGQIALFSESQNSATPSPPATVSSSTAASVGQTRAPATQQNTQLNTGTAPLLASAFSDPFTVFSAKRFPGVIESTGLSRTFAAQGIKIPIRKDNDSKSNGNGKRQKQNEDEEDEDDDFE